MLLLRGVVAFALLAFLVYCVVEVATTDRRDCRTLPKSVWLLIVVLLPVIGAVLWLVAGRPRAERPPAGARPAQPHRPNPRVPASPGDDEAFRRRVRQRAEQQRRAAQRRRRLPEPPPEE